MAFNSFVGKESPVIAAVSFEDEIARLEAVFNEEQSPETAALLGALAMEDVNDDSRELASV